MSGTEEAQDKRIFDLPKLAARGGGQKSKEGDRKKQTARVEIYSTLAPVPDERRLLARAELLLLFLLPLDGNVHFLGQH